MRLNVKVLILAITGLVTFFGLNGYLTQAKSGTDKQREEAIKRFGGESVMVCVTNSEIAPGELFSEDNVTRKSWLVDLLPEDPIIDVSQVVQKASKVPLQENQVLTSGFIDSEDDRPAILVPDNTIGVCIPVSNEAGLDGGVRLGMHIAVYSVVDGRVALLLNDVEVIESSNETVTIAVDPELAQAVVAAASQGRMYCVLPGKSQVDSP